MDTREASISAQMHNAGYTGASALEVRLKTDQILAELKQRFEGKMLIFETDNVTGSVNPKVVNVGKPLMNEDGIQCMLGIVASHINTGTVQGNFTSPEDYNKFMTRFHVKIIDAVFINSPDWAINPNNQRLIIQMVVGLTELFLSRLIYNKEREGYALTLQSRENTTHQQKGGFLPWS